MSVVVWWVMCCLVVLASTHVFGCEVQEKGFDGV